MDKQKLQQIVKENIDIIEKDLNVYGGPFGAVVVDNDFNIDRQHIRPRPLTEYAPVCSVGELCLYRHKSENRLYASTHLSGVFNRKFSLSDSDRLHYQRIFRNHWLMYIGNKIDFEDVLSEKLFIKYWGNV